MQKLWHYDMLNDMTNKNAGYSLWGIGRKDGKEYFVKEFLSPKHPDGDTVSSEARKKRKLAECESFEEKKRRVYQTVNDCSDGNDVRICEFFRIESKYYLSMERIRDLEWTVSDIASLESAERRRLCAIIAHSIAALHSAGAVHCDIKHENVLFTKTERGTVTAKVIDFDSLFFESDPPGMDEKIIGDQNYFPPEVFRLKDGEDIRLNCKMDVFAMGVLFHQYYSGRMPGFEKADSAGLSLYLGDTLTLSDELEEDIRELLSRMLAPEPEDRPTAREVFAALGPSVAPVTEAEPEPRQWVCARCGTVIAPGGKLCLRCSGTITPEAIERGSFFSMGQDL